MATTRSVAVLVRNRAGIRALAVAAALSPAAPLSAAGDTAALTDASAQEHWNAVVVAMAGQSGADGLPALPESAADAPEAALSPEALRWRNAMIIGGGALATGVYGMSHWWKDGFTGKFRARNEGWFGQNTSFGGADKLGHAYANYVGVRLLARGFEAVGNEPRDSLKLATWSTLAVFTTVEIVDAFSKQFHFGKEDTIMNFAGAGLAWLLETRPELDRLIDFRLQYRPSADARRVNQVDPVGDHSGQTFLLIAKASGLPALREHKLLRYVEFAVGFGSRGYDPDVGGERSRHVYAGLSLNLTEVLRSSVFRGSPAPSRSQRVTEGVLEVVQIPGTAVLVDRRL